MESADVVIVGGGIMGCALAYQLSRRKVDVLLLEREKLGSQSTGKCAGGVRQQFSSEGNVRLQRMSVGMLQRFDEEIGHPADFRQLGYLFLLTQPQQVEDFHHNMDMWHRVGLTEARWVDAAEAARMVPILNVEDVLGCTFCPTDGIASPADVTSGYAAAARRLGARLKEGVAVTGIDVASGRVQGVRTTTGGVLIGMSDREELPGYVTDVNWDFLEKMFGQAARRAPALAGAGVKTAWSGLYEVTPDHQAILGPIPELEGFWCAAGFSGHGFMQAPAAALLLTELLLDQKSEIDISSFAFERFARGALVKERNVI